MGRYTSKELTYHTGNSENHRLKIVPFWWGDFLVRSQGRVVTLRTIQDIPSLETWQLQCYKSSQHALYWGDSMWYFLSSLYGVTLPNSTTSTIWPCRLLFITPGHWHKTIAVNKQGHKQQAGKHITHLMCFRLVMVLEMHILQNWIMLHFLALSLTCFFQTNANTCVFFTMIP